MMFGIRLKEMIEESGVSQKELAQKAEVSAWSISQFVNGHGLPRRDTVERLANALGCNVDYLMGDSNVKYIDKNPKKNAEGYNDPTAYEAIKNADNNGARMEVRRGDVFYVSKGGDITGSEMNGGRFAVVVSNDTGNKHSSICEVVFMTTREKKPLPTHVPVMGRVPSTALCEQICNVAQSRLAEYIRSCTDEEMKAIDRALMVSLGLDFPDKQETDDLNMKLEEAEEMIEKLKRMDGDWRIKIIQAETEIKKMTEENEALKAELEKEKKHQIVHSEWNLQFERDFYKEKYESLLAKILERAV